MGPIKKSVGLITMHRVLNPGSALQAYALQRKVLELGYHCEIIDYVFPNNRHRPKDRVKNRLKRNGRAFLSNLRWGFAPAIRKKRFQHFYDRCFSLSQQSYRCFEDIHNNPPSYDIYLTGSDQVWNPKHIKDDCTFFLSFCNQTKSPRIAFAASFATNYIPEELRDLYARHLASYNRISVREKSGIKLVSDLTGQKAEVVCDPTLLLDRNEWSRLAELSSIKIKHPYILAYVLNYAFNPHPQVDGMIEQVQARLNMPVVYLNGRLADIRKKNSCVIKKAGPCEFLWLFRHADFILTTSLHGTAFALNFSKPFCSVIENAQNDSRILSLLQLVGEEDRAKTIESSNIEANIMYHKPLDSPLKELKSNSLTFLENALRC